MRTTKTELCVSDVFDWLRINGFVRFQQSETYIWARVAHTFEEKTYIETVEEQNGNLKYTWIVDNLYRDNVVKNVVVARDLDWKIEEWVDEDGLYRTCLFLRDYDVKDAYYYSLEV